MNDENEAGQSKGCVYRDLPGMVLGGSKLGEKGHGGTEHQRPIGGAKTGVAEEAIVDHGDAGPPHQNDNSKVVEVVEEARNARAVVFEGVEPVGSTSQCQTTNKLGCRGGGDLQCGKKKTYRHPLYKYCHDDSVGKGGIKSQVEVDGEQGKHKAAGKVRMDVDRLVVEVQGAGKGSQSRAGRCTNKSDQWLGQECLHVPNWMLRAGR